MNPFIKEQLNKCKVANLGYWDDNTTSITIPKKVSQLEVTLNVGKSFIIELENYIINPPPNFSLHTNWNNNIVPQYKYMQVKIIAIEGKMLKISGNAIDMKDLHLLEYTWTGWIPKKSMSVIKEI